MFLHIMDLLQKSQLKPYSSFEKRNIKRHIYANPYSKSPLPSFCLQLDKTITYSNLLFATKILFSYFKFANAV